MKFNNLNSANTMINNNTSLREDVEIKVDQQIIKDNLSNFPNFSFESSIALTNPLRNNVGNIFVYSNFQEEEPDMNVLIEMERNFLVDEHKHWTWHKSWNLPNISVTLEVIHS